MPLVKWDYARLSNFYGSGGERYVDYSNPDELLKIINQEKDEMMHFACVETAKKNTLEAMVQDHLSFFKELVK